jgi:hypothetical protein
LEIENQHSYSSHERKGPDEPFFFQEEEIVLIEVHGESVGEYKG